MPKLPEIKGWIDDDETKKESIPTKCPKCGKKLKQTNSLQYCGILLVWCPNSRCRYAEEYTE